MQMLFYLHVIIFFKFRVSVIERVLVLKAPVSCKSGIVAAKSRPILAEHGLFYTIENASI